KVFLLALFNAFVAPWTLVGIAMVLLALAALGAGRLMRPARPVLTTLLVAFGPYLLFDLLFQETVTTRYALPLVVPVAYLAVRGLDVLPGEFSAPLLLVLATFNAATTGVALRAYASVPAPAFRMLSDMSASAPPGARAPVLAMHRRE